MASSRFVQRLPQLDAALESGKVRARAVGDQSSAIGAPLGLDLATVAPAVAVVVQKPRPVIVAQDNFWSQSHEVAHGVGVRNRFRGVFGLPYAGVRRTKGHELQTIAKHQIALGRAIPACAEDLLGWSPGEAAKLVQRRKVHLFTGSLGFAVTWALPLDSWMHVSPLGVDVALEYLGKTQVEVTRLPNAQARLVVSHAKTKHRSTRTGTSLGVHLSTQTIAAWELLRRFRWAARHAMQGAEAMLSKSFGVQASLGHSGQQEEGVIADFVLDLAKPLVRQAYAAAVRGDLAPLSQLAHVAGGGVVLERSLERTMREQVLPRSLKFFGLGLSTHTGNRVETVRGTAAGLAVQRTVTTQLSDEHTRRLPWLAKKQSMRLSDVDSNQAASGLTAHRTLSGRVTSRQALLLEVDWLLFALGDTAPDALRSYRNKVAALPNERLWSVGPRNEAGDVELHLAVHVAAGLLNDLCSKGENAVYQVLAQTWAAEQAGFCAPKVPKLPAWTEPAVRERLLLVDIKPGLHQSLWTSHEREGYRWATDVIDALTMGTPRERKARLARLLAPQAGGGRTLAVLLRLLGPEAVRLSFQVESDVGATGQDLDFILEHRGSTPAVEDPLVF